jgi:5'-nucleotidase / UDP-sugar diphosphatase
MKKVMLGLGLLMLSNFSAKAELIQILHTNDLHSHLEHSIHQTDLGGYARIKVLIDKYRKEASDHGIDTIAMDGGDFMEGNIFYMADKGKKTFEAFGKMGHDVAVLGNHDYLMAADDLENILRDVPPTYNLLAANFELNGNFPLANKYIQPVWETVVNGVKVGVIGLTTNDLLFKWRLKGDGSMFNEVKAAKHYVKYLRQRGNEIIIALTHIGVSKDRWLALNVPEIDLIVGGHSHTALHKMIYQTSTSGKKIPIVQAGKHGEWLGRIMLDYDRKTKSVKVAEYKLLPVVSETQDQEIVDLVSDANDDLDMLYGKDWLSGVVGKSYLRPIYLHNDEKVWQFFINDSMLESSQADFAIHTSPLSGNNYPLGDVSRRDLYNGNPRTFDFEDKYGYNVYTAKITGLWIKLLATACLNLNVPLYFSGITFDWERKSNGKVKVWNIRHKGKKINLLKRYNVAFSEAIIRGAFGISKWLGLVLKKGKRTETSMWQAMEDKFSREGSLHPDYLDRYYRRELSESALTKGGREMERVMVPVQRE